MYRAVLAKTLQQTHKDDQSPSDNYEHDITYSGNNDHAPTVSRPFSQKTSGTPVPSNALAPFIDETTAATQRDARGLFSGSYHTYVPNGQPDVRLVNKVSDFKRTRMGLLNKIRQGVNVDLSSSSNEGFQNLKVPNSDTNDPTKTHFNLDELLPQNLAIEELSNKSRKKILREEVQSLKKDRSITNTSFPKVHLKSSDKRSRLGKLGFPNNFNASASQEDSYKYTTTVNAQDYSPRQQEETSGIFSSHEKLMRASDSHWWSEDNAMSHDGYRQMLYDAKREEIKAKYWKAKEEALDKRTKTDYISNPPIVRWRRQFRSLQNRMDRSLQDTLSQRASDRHEVQNDRAMWKTVTNVVLKHADDDINRGVVSNFQLKDEKKSMSIWTRAKEARDSKLLDAKLKSTLAKRKDFHARIRAFVEENIKKGASRHDVEPLLRHLRRLIDSGLAPMDKSLFPEALKFTGVSVFKSYGQLQVLRFLRQEFGLDIEDCWSYIYQRQWVVDIPSKAERIIMSETRKNTEDDAEQKFESDNLA